FARRQNTRLCERRNPDFFPVERHGGDVGQRQCLAVYFHPRSLAGKREDEKRWAVSCTSPVRGMCRMRLRKKKKARSCVDLAFFFLRSRMRHMPRTGDVQLTAHRFSSSRFPAKLRGWK